MRGAGAYAPNLTLCGPEISPEIVWEMFFTRDVNMFTLFLKIFLRIKLKLSQRLCGLLWVFVDPHLYTCVYFSCFPCGDSFGCFLLGLSLLLSTPQGAEVPCEAQACFFFAFPGRGWVYTPCPSEPPKQRACSRAAPGRASSLSVAISQ